MRPISILLLSLYLLVPTTPAPAADPATFTVGAFTFQRPAAWQWVPVNSPMRKAQLRIETKPGQSADVTFFTFGAGQGGPADQNIARWEGQFALKPDAPKPVVESATIKGTKITRIRVETGTFTSGMPGGPASPMPDWGLYGAILESPQGDVYIKLTGPADVVKTAAASFEGLIQSPF